VVFGGFLTFSVLLLPGILIFMACNFGGVGYYEGEQECLFCKQNMNHTYDVFTL
jgi:hypothetical protein